MAKEIRWWANQPTPAMAKPEEARSKDRTIGLLEDIRDELLAEARMAEPAKYAQLIVERLNQLMPLPLPPTQGGE